MEMRLNLRSRRAIVKEYFPAVVFTVLLGMQLFPVGVMAGAPEASGPVCVPVPGMPCPGSSQNSSSGTSGSTYSSGKRSTKPSASSIMLQELQNSIDQMTTPNPDTLKKIRKTRMEGDQALQEEIMSQQATEEQRQQRAQSGAEAARMQQIHDLSSTLQGLPGTANSSLDLRPGGTPFFGLGGGTGSAPPSGLNIEELRDSGSSGFDTRGPLSGQILTPPPASPPTPVGLTEKPIPPEQVTPEIRALLDERDEIRSRKKEMQESLERLENKDKLTPEESAALKSLQQGLAVILNKENFLSFTINESLP